MTIVNPIAVNSPAGQAGQLQPLTAEERQAGLQLNQIVRATVVEGGLDGVLLEMNQRRYQAQSDLELQAGQRLSLQVLKTHPKLELRILPEQLSGRLSQLLPLLSRPYDWSALVGQLQQHGGQPQPTAEIGQVFNQLQQLLRPGSPGTAGLHEQIARLAAQLSQLPGMPSEQVLLRPAVSAVTPPGAPQAVDLSQLMAQLERQVARLPLPAGEPVAGAWERQAQNLLQQFLSAGGQLQTQLSKPQLISLELQLRQIAQQPQLGPQLLEDVEQLLTRLPVQLQRSQAGQSPATAEQLTPGPTSPQHSALGPALQRLKAQFGQLAARLPPAADPGLPSAGQEPLRAAQNAVQQALLRLAEPGPLPSPAPLPAGQFAELQAVLRQVQNLPSLPAELKEELGQILKMAPSEVPVGLVNKAHFVPPAAQGLHPAQPPGESAAAQRPASALLTDLERLLGQVQEVQSQQKGLPPELLGRLEGLLEKIRQLPQASLAQSGLTGLEAVADKLSQLVQQAPLRPEGGQLGFLSQLFGFHLEAELLAGRKKAALASLKLGLLNLRGELTEAGEEPLRRLELFQLCKAKLAEEQVQFLPLPFPELEEGYLLAEEGRRDGAESEAPLQLSLALRLSGLGEMRIDMLYEKGDLHLRLACQDREKMNFIQDCSEELAEALTSVTLRGVSYTDNAQSPTQLLLERLLPPQTGVLDDRV